MQSYNFVAMFHDIRHVDLLLDWLDIKKYDWEFSHDFAMFFDIDQIHQLHGFWNICCCQFYELALSPNI